MENEDKIENALRIAIMANIDYILTTIENETYKEFSIDREENRKALLKSLGYIINDFVNESFNRIGENKKLEKKKQKSIVVIFSQLVREFEIEYITQCQKFGNQDKSK